MKGIVFTKFGTPDDVLEVKEVKKPVPKANQVLIKVKYSAINRGDYSFFTNQIKSGKNSFSDRLMALTLGSVGKVLGSEIAGIVEEVGKNVTNIKKGNEVFAPTANGILGGWAEYALANEKQIAIKPSNLSFEQAAAIPIGGITAFGAVSKANIQKEKQVLVYGASGGVGQYVVQLSKALGGIVTAVCSTRNVEIVRKIGADFVIDYKNEDFTKTDRKYDAIIAVNGYNSLGKYKKILNRNGVYVAIGGAKQGMFGMLFGWLYSIFTSKKMTASTYFLATKQQPLQYLGKLAEESKIIPFIEKTFPMNKIGDAMTYIIKNHAQGKIVIEI